MVEIKTKRLSIRHIKPKYKQSLITLIGDENVAATLSNVPFPYTESDADWWIESVKSKPYSLNVFYNHKLIGGVGLTEQAANLFELGYWIGQPYWGNGYATEACLGLLRYVRDAHGDAQVFANVYPDNHASEKVLCKLGFVEDGTDVTVDVSTKEQVVCHRYVLTFARLPGL